eukprot:scaffold16656_cov19-Tisochrysis_lutea.AAC.1
MHLLCHLGYFPSLVATPNSNHLMGPGQMGGCYGQCGCLTIWVLTQNSRIHECFWGGKTGLDAAHRMPGSGPASTRLALQG